MPKCRACFNLIPIEDYYKRGGEKSKNDKDYYCLFRGITLTEKQKEKGDCETWEPTFPDALSGLQKVEESPEVLAK